MKIVFVASIIRNKLYTIYVVFDYFFKNLFLSKLFSDCNNRFDFPGSIILVLFSKGVIRVRNLQMLFNDYSMI